MTTHARPTHAAIVAAVLVAILPLLGLPGSAGAAVTSRTDITGASTVEIALAYTALIPDDGAPTVLLGRDDLFADSLASGPLQTTAPLLLTPADSLPPAVAAELERLGTRSITIMGGAAAISEDVEAELAAAGHTVRRVQGPSRIETALDAAAELAGATEALMVRASASGDPTRAFADALAAGAWAQAAGLPVLLTQTSQLHPATAQFLQLSSITTVHLIGGEAALSPQVQADLEALDITVDRIAGETRFATATAIAAARDDLSAPERIIVVEGQADDAWARGFPAAFFADEAPLLLANGATVPQETLDYLMGPAFAQVTEDVEVVCAADAAACDIVVDQLGGLGSAFTVTVETTVAAPGEQVTGTIGGDLDDIDTVAVSGCLGTITDLTTDGDGQFTVPVPGDAEAGECTFTVTITPLQGDPVEHEAMVTILGDYTVTLDSDEAIPGDSVDGILGGDLSLVTGFAASGCFIDESISVNTSSGAFTATVPEGTAAMENCTVTFTVARGEADSFPVDVSFTVLPAFETLTVFVQQGGALVLFSGGSVTSLDADGISGGVTIGGVVTDAQTFENRASFGDEIELASDGQTANLNDRDGTFVVTRVPTWSESADAFEFRFDDSRTTPIDTSGRTLDVDDADVWRMNLQAGPLDLTVDEMRRSIHPGARISVTQSDDGTLTWSRVAGTGQVHGVIREADGAPRVQNYLDQNPLTVQPPNTTTDRLFVGSLGYSLFSATSDVTERSTADWLNLRRPGQIINVSPDPDGEGRVFTLRTIPLMGSVGNLNTSTDRFTLFDVGHPFFPTLAGPGQQGFALFSNVTYGTNQDIFSRGVNTWRYLDGNAGAFETRVQSRDYVIIIPEPSDNGIASVNEL